MAFSAGFDALINVNATDISAYTTSVKFSPARKDFDLPVLGANPVKSMVGPVKTLIDLSGFIDPAATGVFTALMAQTVPVAVAVIYEPQGSTTGLPKRTCNAFCVDFAEDTESEGPGKWTAKLAVDGLVTFTTNP
jgi:hypothetical protein